MESSQVSARENLPLSHRVGADVKISVVVPVFNSAESLGILVPAILTVLQKTGHACEIVLVDDCSSDDSWKTLQRLRRELGGAIKIAQLLTNSGQHNAILCGFSLAKGEIIVTMDDDLQNPPEEIPKLIAAIDQGYDLAIGAYDSKKHGVMRNASGGLVDFLQRRIFHLPPDFQLTSFRAIKRIVVDNVCQMGGVFPYITSMVLSHTSKFTNVDVTHEPRRFGRSNYNLKRSVRLAANLILNYSSYPLYFVAALCLLAFLFSLGYGLAIIYAVVVHGNSVPGWASTMVIISFFNALVLLCLLIFGLYLSRINQQLTRRRVSYTIGELYQ